MIHKALKCDDDSSIIIVPYNRLRYMHTPHIHSHDNDDDDFKLLQSKKATTTIMPAVETHKKMVEPNQQKGVHSTWNLEQ